jgi:hypothetical protein
MLFNYYMIATIIIIIIYYYRITYITIHCTYDIQYLCPS